ncbi:hypothetical protein MA4S0206_0942 [Mycobacteroides abscessus 4S-0206]|nr:hypothetical protein MA4S0206_0942 [Mycobacteroides abscessus 4S-0206]
MYQRPSSARTRAPRASTGRIGKRREYVAAADSLAVDVN